MARQLLLIIVVFSVFGFINSGIVDKKLRNELKDLLKKDDGAKTEELSGLFEGDIDMDESMKRALTSGKISLRDAILSPVYHWPNGKVYFKFHRSINYYTEHQIYYAMEHIEKHTCVRFKRYHGQPSKNYVIFFKGKGCYSRIGRNPKSRSQRISIGRGCTRLGTIVHEIMHAIGFFHEQSRQDRDKFIKILWQNIIKKHIHNFRKYPRLLGTNLSKPYDYLSVMHYSRFAFSKNRYRYPTIVARKKNVIMGQRFGLSYYDAYQINKLYRCDPPCSDHIHPFACEYFKEKGFCRSYDRRLSLYMRILCTRTCTKCGSHSHNWK